GTGLGIAFFMYMAHRTGDAATIAATARTVVIADAMFTLNAVIAQPVSGAALALSIGYSLWGPWIVLSLVLYVVIRLGWRPWVAIRRGVRELAAAAARAGGLLPPDYERLFRIWFALGWPAFLGVIAIFGLMIFKPQLW